MNEGENIISNGIQKKQSSIHNYHKALGLAPRTPRLLIHHLYLSLSVKIIFYAAFVSSTQTQYLKNGQMDEHSSEVEEMLVVST